MSVIHMDDFTLLIEGRGDHALAAEDALRAEPGAQNFQMAHSIQEGKYGSFRTYSGRERCHRAGKIVGFAAQQDEMEMFRKVLRGDGWRRAECNIAVRTLNSQTVLS